MKVAIIHKNDDNVIFADLTSLIFFWGCRLSILVTGPRFISISLLTSQKIKFSNKDFFSKFGQIRSSQRIWSHLLKISLMENFIFCAVMTAVKPHLCIINLINKTSTCYVILYHLIWIYQGQKQTNGISKIPH